MYGRLGRQPRSYRKRVTLSVLTGFDEAPSAQRFQPFTGTWLASHAPVGCIPNLARLTCRRFRRLSIECSELVTISLLFLGSPLVDLPIFASSIYLFYPVPKYHAHLLTHAWDTRTAIGFG